MKEKILVSLFLLCSFGTIYSQKIEGRIFNAAGSDPVENANIENITSGERIVSDGEGRFALEVEEFPVNLHISAPGFSELLIEVKSLNENFNYYLTPSSESLSEVIIRSTIIPSRLQKVAAPVNILSENDLKRSDNINLVQEFNRVPGVFVNQGALNTNKINIRGIGARAQYSTNRIQSYFDGIPLTTAEGELTLDDIDPESLERIEIIKGPTSSLYGAGLGGSINLYSKTPVQNKTRASVKSQVGSFNTQKNIFQAGHAEGNTTLNFNVSSLTSDGYRDNGEYDRKSAILNGKVETSAGNSLSFLANFTKLKAFIPSSINEEDFLQNPQTADANWEASRGFEFYDRGMLGTAYKHNFSENFSNTTSIYMSFRDAYEPRPFDILKEERVSAGARSRFNLSTSLLQRPSEISFGAEYFNEWYETATFENLFREFPNSGSVLGAHLSNNEQDRNYFNIFARFMLEITDRWNLEAGFNYNSTSYTLTDLYVEDEVDQTGNYSFDGILSPRLGTSYEISTGKNIYASVSHGFSTPTVAETLTPEGQINTDLQPETGINYEAGFKGNWLNNKLYTEVSVFSIQIDDLLVAQRVAEDRYVGLNAGKTSHNGIEFLTSYTQKISSGITAKAFLNGAVNFYEFEEFINNDEDFSGNDIPGVPKSSLNAGLDLLTEWGLELYSSFQAVDEIPLNDANTAYADSYNILNLKAAYGFQALGDVELNIFGGINNVLDEHYAASVLTNAVGFGGAAPRFYYPGNPRNYFAGLQLNYVF